MSSNTIRKAQKLVDNGGVVKIEDDKITVDANHPLAGETLHFSVSIEEIRDANKEELSHGHVHAPGGHSH